MIMLHMHQGWIQGEERRVPSPFEENVDFMPLCAQGAAAKVCVVNGKCK